MPGLFSRMRGKDGQGKSKSKKGANLDDLTQQLPQQPRWEDAYTRTSVDPEEVGELIHVCTGELKARALDLPFLLLPFRPTSDPSAVRNFIRHFFDGAQPSRGESLVQEMRMTEPMVISGVLKWCWSRLQGGVVGWDAYELFKVGEQDSNMARDSFRTFIPLSVDNEVRVNIIFDFFDLMSAVAAHGKSNGFGGRKLSRMASWWAFEHKDTENGFEGGYKAWLTAADATSHLFFAYLRSLAPQPTIGGISILPMSLQKLLQETEYPPEKPSLMQSTTNRVVMIVDSVSPTPFALLRRANHFQYRENDRALHQFSEYDDPVNALTEECRRVLKAISLANQKSQVSSTKHSTGLRDASWSRFEDIGFGGVTEEEDDDESGQGQARKLGALRTTPASGAVNLGRPTTPSWADFLSSGFVDESQNSPSMLLPPDKVLPPIDITVRQRSSQSHNPRLESSQYLEPGELANITRFDLDESFWWVWMSSLAPEETPARKSAFGRCAVIETIIRAGRWLVMEEMVKGAAPEPEAGAYVAEKKGLFSWTRRNKDKGLTRAKSSAGKRALDSPGNLNPSGTMGGMSKTSVGPDQQARIQAAAQQLQAKQQHETQNAPLPFRRGRTDTELMREKTTSILTLQPAVMKEASPAMKWANKYDKDAIRDAYLSSTQLGRGLEHATMQRNGHSENNSMTNGSPHRNVPARSPTISPQSSPGLVSPMAYEQANGSRNRTPEPFGESEKDIEASQDVHPSQRMVATGRDSPLPPPSQANSSMDAARANMFTPEPANMSPEGKKQQKKLHKELHKEEKKSGGGFRKLFGRKNRASKVPENAASDVNKMIVEPPAAAPEQRPEPVPSAPAVVSAPEPPLERIEEATPTPSQAEQPHGQEPAYEPSVEENLSRVDTAEAAEANQAFSSFDQGPLSDQPAFVPEEDGSEDEATPPPIARQPHNPPRKERPVVDQEEIPSTGIPALDRWAQIKKNAAIRAAEQQRARNSEDRVADRTRLSEERSRGGHSKATTEGDDETSGEETIESRVARIKARVAELTGNMETTTPVPGVPGARTPPSRR